MKQLKALTGFLINLNLVAAEQIDTWAENPQIVPAGTVKGAKSIVLYRQKYDAQIVIERYPHKRHPAELLFGHVCAWLMDNDGDDVRSDGSEASVQIEVDINDDHTADLVLTIDFMEDVTAIEDVTGTITLAGKQYRLADMDIYYAETGDLTAQKVA